MSNRKGFTLVELLIAVTILAVGLVGVLRAYCILINGLEVAQHTIDASLFLKEKIVGLERCALEQGSIPPGSSEDKLSTVSGALRWESQVEMLKSESSATKKVPAYGLDKVEIKVYMDALKPPRKLTLATYVEVNE